MRGEQYQTNTDQKQIDLHFYETITELSRLVGRLVEMGGFKICARLIDMGVASDDNKHKQQMFKTASNFQTQSTSSLHACPFCRCSSPPALYLSRLCPPLAMTFPLAHSSRFSPPPIPITFSYLSPPPLRHRSSQRRFSTRKYKETHFPHLKDQHTVSTPIKRIVRPSLPIPPCKTNQKTPQKHKILKMNKTKSKRYSQQQREQLQQTEKTVPIEMVRMEKSQCDMVVSSHLRTDKELEGQIQIMETVQELVLPMRKVESNQTANYHAPTSKSIEYFEKRRDNENYSNSSPSSHSSDETSLKLIAQQPRSPNMPKILNPVSIAEQARSLSLQLQLNYDYYVPGLESDRSLSLHLSF